MRALCHRYGVELHNFAPNAISQAATFVSVCEGYLGIPVNWELSIHLFRAELFTQPTTEQRTRRAMRAGGMSLALRAQFKDDYISCTMTTNNTGWERGWFYLRNTEPGLPPYTGLVLREKPTIQHQRPWGVHDPASEAAGLAPGRPEEPGDERADRGGSPRLPPPPADRASDGEAARHLRDDGGGGPVALVRSRMLPTPLKRGSALTRARNAVDTRMLCQDRSPWDLEMLPTGPLVSMILGPIFVLDVASDP
jgi:hypothetical protein